MSVHACLSTVIRAIVWIAATLTVVPSAFAQVTSPYRPSASNAFPAFEIKPFDQPIWFDPSRPGTGWSLGSFPSPIADQPPLMAAAHYTFNATSQATWFLAQSAFEATSWAELRSTSKVGHFAGDVAGFAGGACPTCPYVAPATSETPYRAIELKFVAATRARVRFDGIDAGTIIPLEFAVSRPIDAFLVGRWTGVMRRLSGMNPQTVEERVCDIEIVREANPTTQDRWERKDPAVEHVPATGAAWFSIVARTCAEEGLDLYWVAVDSATHIVRGFPLNSRGFVNSPEPIFESSPLGRPLGFRIGDGAITEWYLHSSDVVIVRSRLNRIGSEAVIRELRFERRR